MNDIEFEEQLKGLRQEAMTHLQGWEFTPAMRQRVLERIAAEPEQSEPAPGRRPLRWGPWMAAVAVAASVATVAVFTGGRSLQVDKMGRAAQMAVPQASAPAPERAAGQAPAADSVTHSTAARAPEAGAQAQIAAQPQPAATPSDGAGAAAVPGTAGQQAAATEQPADAGAGIQMQQAVPPAEDAVSEVEPDRGGAGTRSMAEATVESAAAPVESAAVAEQPAAMAAMPEAGVPAAGDADPAAKAEPAAVGGRALPAPLMAALDSDLQAEVLAAAADASVRVAAHLRPRDSIWQGPVEVQAWVLLPDGERLLLEPRLRRLPDDIPVGEQATVVFGWNGLDPDGRPLAAGTYHVQIEARAADGRSQLAGATVELTP